MLQIRLLGQFDVRADGKRLLIPTRAGQSLFAFLILNSATEHRREKLAGTLWGDVPEETARKTLRQELWRIRKALAAQSPADADSLRADPLTVGFFPAADFWLDVTQLNQTFPVDGALNERINQVAVFQGELLPGFYDDWVVLEREHVQGQFEARIRELLELLIAGQHWQTAVAWAEKWIALGQTPEAAYRALILTYAMLGDRAQCAAAYERCKTALWRDLAVEPSDETRQLYEELMRGDTIASVGLNSPRVLVGIKPSLQDQPPAPGEPPFKGLQAFEEQDAALFFGREALTQKLAQALRTSRFLAVVVGASGSGKSSVVRAGLIPTLKGTGDRGQETGNGNKGNDWRVFVMTPTAQPLEALALALTREAESVTATATLMDDLARDPRALYLYLRRQTTGDGQRKVDSAHPSSQAERIIPHPLLVVDQFEELFTLCRDELAREQFIDNLVYAIGQASPQDGASGIAPTITSSSLIPHPSSLSVILTLRADFYPHLAQYPELRDLVAQHQEYIGPMTSNELRRAMEEPAKLGGWEFEPGLVDLILRDIGDEPGALPLLSHALLETWKRRSRHTLTLKGYHDAGGVRGAIAHTAETSYEQLSSEQQAIARSIFLRLTEFGEATEDTRRRASMDELVPQGQQGDLVRAVLIQLADARLVTTSEQGVEVAHEALIREWPRLREWLNEDRDGLRLHRHLTEAAQEWELLERDAGALYRGARLAQATEWASQNPIALNEQESAFLTASEEGEIRELREREELQQRELEAAQKLAAEQEQRAEEHSRAAKQLRQRALFLAGAFVLALVLAGIALLLGDRANRNAVTANEYAVQEELARAEAESQKRVAIARELAASAIANLEVDAERSVLLALQAVAATRNVDGNVLPEAEDALHRAVLASRIRFTLREHQDEVFWVAYSPDGTRFASGDLKTTRIWDAATSKLLQTVPGLFLRDSWHDPTRLATYSKDDKTITLQFWNADSGQLVSATRFEATGQEGPAAFISRDQTRVVLGYEHGEVEIRDVANGEKLLDLVGHTEGIGNVAFSPDGKMVASASGDGTAKVWDTKTGEQIVSIPVGFAVTQVIFSPDGTRLVTGDQNNVARIWELPTGKELLTLYGHTNWVTDIAFSPDAKRIATSSWDRTARVWDVATGRTLFTLSGHEDFVWSIAFSPDGQRLVTGGRDKLVKVWDAAPSSEVFALDTGARVSRAAMNADASRLITVGRKVQLWDFSHAFETEMPSVKRVAAMSSQPPNPDATFSPDGKRILTSSAENSGFVWDAETGKQVFALPAEGLSLIAAFSPDGEMLALTAAESVCCLYIWEAGSGKQLLKISEPGQGDYGGVTFSPDGKQIITGHGDGKVFIRDVITGALLSTFPAHSNLVWDVRFSPDGKRLITSSRDATAKVWDTATWKELFTLRGHTSTVERSMFNRDGTLILTASNDGTAKVWDAATGKELLTFYGSTSGVTSALFSPDGTRVLTTSVDDGVRIYLLRIEDLVALAKARVTRALTPEECSKYLHVEKCPE